MLHLHEEDLELFVLGRLDEKKVAAVESHLIECQQCRTKLANAKIFKRQLVDFAKNQTAYKGPEKRSEARISTNDSASMRVLSPMAVERIKVQVLDTSKNGLRFRCAKSIETGSIVQLHWQNKLVMGEVRYCLKMGDSFYAGIVIHDFVTEAKSLDIR